MTQRATDSTMRETELAAWVAGLVGAGSVTFKRRPGGGSHEAWDVLERSKPKWFLRADAVARPAHVRYTLRREAEIYRAVHAIGIPTPDVLGIHPTYEAVLLERAQGEAGFARLERDAQIEVIDDFALWLAKLHSADIAELDLSALGRPATIAESVVTELDNWQERLDASGVPDPILTACFMWLRDNVPDTGDLRPSLVQGDTGPGNFLHDGHRVTAFLDFELAHFGDPMTDIAWVGTRNAQEPVPDFERMIARYEAGGGCPVDRDRVRYHFLLAEVRIAALGAEREGAAAELEAEHGNRLIYGALHRRLTVEALATAMGVPMPQVELPVLIDTDDTRYFDAALHQMRYRIGPEIDDPWADRLLKGLARVVKYLREVDRAGSIHQQAELDDQQRLLGRRPASMREGAETLLAKVQARELSAADLLPYAANQVARRTQLVGPAMGALATRHLPAL
jgi:aminoglycoside phosphotransferase (APT) family kinase protein